MQEKSDLKVFKVDFTGVAVKQLGTSSMVMKRMLQEIVRRKRILLTYMMSAHRVTSR